MLLQLLNKNGSTGEERSIAEGILSIGQNAGGNVHAFLIDDGSSLTLIIISETQHLARPH